MHAKRKVTTTTIKSVEYRLTGKDIVDLLIKSGENLGRIAEVEFHVPGGGDWSHMDIEINSDNPIIIRTEITEEE